MHANKVFEQGERHGRRNGVGFFSKLSGRPAWGHIADLALSLFTAAASATAVFANLAWWTVVLAVLAVVAAIIQCAIRRSGISSKFADLLRGCQDFIDTTHAYLLNGATDLRVTLLLPYYDRATKETFLRPFMRNEGHPVGGRRLKVDLTKGSSEGAAGRAWITGETISVAASIPYAECTNEAKRTHYCRTMHATPALLDRVGMGRNPTYVLACALRHGRAKERLGVLCIDGLTYRNVMGEPGTMEEMKAQAEMPVAYIQAQLVESLVVSSSEKLAHLLARVYVLAGANTDGDD